MDASRHFLESARIASPGLKFIEHDVTAAPFPCGAADVIFCRFLLTHLEQPREAIVRWATQLSSGGMILIEETAAVRTDVTAFARYLAIVEAMLASQANHLYAGAMLDQFEWPAGLHLAANLTRRVSVRNCDAARMFVLNLRNWRANEFIRTHYPDDEITATECSLEELARGESELSAIEWEIRQTSLVKIL